MTKRNSLDRAEMALREHALGYPGATEDFPWGHRAIKIKGKIFLSIYREKDLLSLSLKLPNSGKAALQLPFASPTRYGLAKSGWVTCSFNKQDELPQEMIEDWIDESFRAVAPKRALANLDAQAQAKPADA